MDSPSKGKGIVGRNSSSAYKLKKPMSQKKGDMMINKSFDIKPGDSPIVPIMLYDAVLSQKMAEALLEKGIYVIGFYFPVVPKDKARIRVQISAGHERHHLDKAIQAFIAVGKDLGVI